MTAQAAYKQFLAAPNSSLLADDATLSYITSTTSFTGATDIIKHYSTLRNQIKKKGEEVIDVIEAQNAVWIEIATTFEFLTSGAVYLPGLDDNFLTDRTVTITIDHVVRFDAEGKIKSIRQNWDQGCLLGQVGVIGRTGRSWPIRDAKDQIKMINKLEGAATDEQDAITRNRSTSNNAMRDPHASLSLFGHREDLETHDPASVISPRKAAGARPRQRSVTEILGQEPVKDGVPTGRERSPSKTGGGKNFVPNRLFEAQQEYPEDPDTPERPSPDRMFRPNPTKYSHFDFADGSDPQDTPKAAAADDVRPKSKHDSSWGFEDFVTPHKTLPTRGLNRNQDRVHWSTGDDDEVDETPISKPNLPKPRRDAKPHFQFVDDGESHGERRLFNRRGEAHNDGLGLYHNNLYNETGEVPSAEDPRALGNITNMKNRNKAFESHFAITDESPDAAASTSQPAKMGEDRKKAVKMMDSTWDSYDESPKQKENIPLGKDVNGEKLAPEKGGRIYAVAGNGMGSKKGSRGWSIGDSDGEDDMPKQVAPKGQNTQSQSKNNFWDF